MIKHQPMVRMPMGLFGMLSAMDYDLTKEERTALLKRKAQSCGTLQECQLGTDKEIQDFEATLSRFI